MGIGEKRKQKKTKVEMSNNSSSSLDVSSPAEEEVGDSLEAYYSGDDNWSKVVFEFVLVSEGGGKKV